MSASSETTPGNFPRSHYDGGPSWSGSVDNVLVYQALQWLEDANGKVVNFTGLASGLVDIAAGAPRVLPPIVLSPVGTHEVTGTYALPSGYALTSARLFVETGALLSFQLPGDPTASGGSFSARAPSIGNAVFTAQVEAWSGDFVSQARSTVPENAPPVALDLQPANLTLGPADGATGVTHDTVFSFTPSGFGVHAVLFTGTGRPNYFIVTTGTEVRIPDLRAYGITLPTNTTLFWSVHSWGPYASVDELATAGSFHAPAPVSYYKRTDVPSFVTAP